MLSIISSFLYYPVVFHCINAPQFVFFFFLIPLVDRYLDSFQSLAFANKASRNVLVQNFLWAYVLVSLGYKARSGIAGS